MANPLPVKLTSAGSSQESPFSGRRLSKKHAVTVCHLLCNAVIKRLKFFVGEKHEEVMPEHGPKNAERDIQDDFEKSHSEEPTTAISLYANLRKVG